METDFLDLPNNFRQDVFEKILKAVNRHESVTLVAPPGMGKTLTMQLLVKRLVNCLYIDLNSLWEKNIPTDKPLTIILDHAENFSDQLYFKSVRESGRDKINFVFAVSGSILPTGPLDPVIMENIIYLEPLNTRDARIFLEKCEQLFRGKLTSKQKQEIFILSGGVPRLIKRLVKLFIDGLDPTTDLKFQNDLGEINKFYGRTATTDETVGKIQFKDTLSKQEYLLAKLLIENKDKMVTREAMIEAVWQSKMYDVNEHALDQMLHRLRKKLATATPKCNLISFRGRGCKLEIV
ncbi:MAG: helix-turn-helix domain-containing protein [Patescibacteria group bacterium]